MNILNAWLDCIFPPLCTFCKEPCRTKLFCPTCWDLCSLPDAEGRCRHCFSEIDGDYKICRICRDSPLLAFPSAFVFESTQPALRLCKGREEDPDSLAAFALLQWERLEWPFPDAIVPLPEAKSFARSFASWLDRPCLSAERLDEDAILLLLGKCVSLKEIHEASERICEAFPKKVYVLTLFHVHSTVDSDLEFARSGPVSGCSYRS